MGQILEPWVDSPLEPWGEREDHGMIPRRTEYCHQSRMGQMLDRKESNFHCPNTDDDKGRRKRESMMKEKVKALVAHL